MIIMNLVELFWKQAKSCVLKDSKHLNWYLLNNIKSQKNEPEEMYYYEGDGVVCCTLDYNTWSMNNKMPNNLFKVAYH